MNTGTDTTSAPGMHIMVVEDEALIAEELCDCLARLNYQVVGVVDTAQQAIRIAKQMCPELILMDIRLKDPTDGLASVEHIYRHLNIPIVYLTDHSQQATLLRAEGAAQFGYVLKPFQERDLMVAIEMAADRHKLEQRLKESERDYTVTLASIADAVITVDAEGRVRFMNPVAETMTGWRLGEACGLPVERILVVVDALTQAMIENPVTCAFRTHAVASLTEAHLLIDRQSAAIPIEGSAAPIMDAAGHVSGAVVTFRDISARKQAEQALHISEERYRMLVEQASDGIFISDAQGKFLDVNAAGCELLGYSRDEMLKLSLADVVAPAEALRAALEVARLLDGSAVRSEWCFQRKGGSFFHGEISARQLPNFRLLAILRDTTDRKHAEEALQEARSFLQLVVDASPSMIFVKDEQGKIIFVNQYTAHYYGATPDQMVAESSNVAYRTISEAHRFMRGEQDVFRTGKRVIHEELNTCSDGMQHWFHTVQVPFVRPDGSVAVLGIATDITERKQAEEALIAARVEWEQSFNALTDYICVFDRTGRILRANRAMRECFEPIHGSLIGLDYRLVYYGTATPLPEPVCTAVLVGGPPVEAETTLPTLPGHFLISCYPLENAKGECSGVVHVVRDITQQRKLEAQLRQSQKMQAIGQLAGGVAHDFNNLLTIINGYCDLLLSEVTDLAGPLREPVIGIRDAGERAAQLTHQLLLLSRKAVLKPQVLNLNDVLLHAGKMLQRLIGEHITLTTLLSPVLHQIKADPGQLEQVVINLCLNAQDAMPQGGHLLIGSRNVFFDADDCRTSPDYKPGHFVHLTVSDTGCGMTPDVKAHLFEPFFTTKSPGKGTGLGLATVYSIIQQTGGFITVSSDVGVGTIFNVFLPAAANEASAGQADQTGQPTLTGSETVLLVEDEDGVRRVARRVLDIHGYAVLEATNGPAALQLAEQHPGPIELLVTDVVMPGMSGRQLAELLRTQHRDLRILFMSGYNDDAVIRHGIFEATDAFLQKPFTPRVLAKKVRDVLDARAS